MLPFFPLWGRPSQWPLLFVFFLNVASIFGIRESVQSLFPTDSERITQYINDDLLHAWILKLNYRNEGFFPQAMEFITSRNEGNFMGKLKYLTSKGKSPQKGNMTWFNYRVNRKIVSQISHWGTYYYMSTYSKLQQLFRWYGAFKFFNSLFPRADLEEFNNGLLDRS